MTKFKGCIDIHNGQVKQIVGGTLSSDRDEETALSVKTNFVSAKPSSFYAELYKDNNVQGTHVIKLGSSEENNKAADIALKTWPDHLQIGGGINSENALEWIKKGAAKVIITSWLFPNGNFSEQRLTEISQLVGRERLVVDLSCRRVEASTDWYVAINKWTVITSLKLTRSLFVELSKWCLEFLIHAADVEGLCSGIDETLVETLGDWFKHESLVNVKVVYAGGAKSLDDLKLVDKLSGGAVDLTYGSALDIFGGNLVRFEDCVKWNSKN